jgi:rubredoxin
MAVVAVKIPGGYSFDGLELKNGKCGCTSIAKCCYSWSKLKKKSDSAYEFAAKMTTADSKDNFAWSYTVRKDGITVSVRVEDARDKDISSAYIPPAAAQWAEKGWEIIEQEGTREDGAVWRCAMCKWLYKEDQEGTPFQELPDDWVCPVCKAPKSAFEKIG